MVTAVQGKTQTAGMGDCDEAILDSQTRRMQASRLRVALFSSLQSDNQRTRYHTLQKIFSLIRSYALTSVPKTDLQNPIDRDRLKLVNAELSSSPESTEADEDNTLPSEETRLEVEEAAEQLHLYLLTLLRLSISCPYYDVRQRCKRFLDQAQASGIQTPTLIHNSPSFFIAEPDIAPLFDENDPLPANKLSPLSPLQSSWVTSSKENHSDDITDPRVKDVDRLFQSQFPSSKPASRPVDEYLWQLTCQNYLTHGRITNLSRVLAYFPTYLEAVESTLSVILRRSIGPLHPPWRYYLGIMAAAEHQCQYLVQHLSYEFLQHGGDKSWLLGILHVPFKLRSISRLLLRLSRQPWRLEENDIAQLMRHNTIGTPVSDTWSTSELVHATMIFANVLSMSSFVGACGVVCEPDMCGGFMLGEKLWPGVEHAFGSFHCQDIAPQSDEQAALDAASAATGWYEDPMNLPSLAYSLHEHHHNTVSVLGIRLNSPSQNQVQDHEADIATESEIEDRTNEIISILKETAQTNTSQDASGHCLRSTSARDNEDMATKNYPVRRMSEGGAPPTSEADLPSTVNTYVNAIYEDLDRFVDKEANKVIEYDEFDIKKHEELNLGDFSWETEACDLVNHYLPSVGEYMDSEFHEALSITDWSIFNQQEDTLLDTSPLRRALWFYCLKLYGVKKEDYDYSDIARLVSPRVKRYLKKVCCDPHSIRLQDWKTIGISLRPEEKCHVNVLASEAKKQALLCCMLSMLARL